MLAATVETEPGEEKLLPLTLESQRLWPDFARELEAASGISLDYRDEGTLVVALNRDDAETLRHSYEFQKGLGLDLDWLSAPEARRREPHLKPGIAAGGLQPARPPGRQPRLAQALVAACRARRRRDSTSIAPVQELIVAGGRAAGVVTDQGEARADVVVLAAGAWSREIGGIPAAAPAAGAPDQGPDAGAADGPGGAADPPCGLGCRTAIWCRATTAG